MTSTDGNPQAGAEVSLFARLRAMRDDLDAAEQKLLDDPGMGGAALDAALARLNASHADIDVEEGRLNEEAIRARENDPEIRQLLQALDNACDQLAAARAEMQKATARAQEAVEVIGKVEGVLGAFADLALKLA